MQIFKEIIAALREKNPINEEMYSVICQTYRLNAAARGWSNGLHDINYVWWNFIAIGTDAKHRYETSLLDSCYTKVYFRQHCLLSKVMHLRRQSFNRIANPERSSGAPIGKEPANSVANAEMITKALGPTPWFWSTWTLMKCDAAAVPKFLFAV